MALNGVYGVNGWLYQNSGPASAYSQFIGNHAWWTASSGTAALSTLTYVQVMTLNTSGRLTIFSTASSTSTTTGALVVTGGVGIGGALYVNTTSYIAGAQIITTTTIGQYASSSANNASSTGTTSTFFINNTTTSTGTTTGALVVTGGVGIGDNLYVANTSYIGNSKILTQATAYDYIMLRGQYIPRTGYVSGSTITIDASLYDNYVVTATGSTTVIQLNTTNGYTPFDGQKLIIRLLDNGVARLLSWRFETNHFRIVGIAPPQVTLVGSTVYVGVMYNQMATTWDILSAVIQ
jgi:hypothetical protein